MLLLCSLNKISTFTILVYYSLTVFGAVHGVIGDKVLNTYLNDVVTVPEYGRVFVLWIE